MHLNGQLFEGGGTIARPSIGRQKSRVSSISRLFNAKSPTRSRHSPRRRVPPLAAAEPWNRLDSRIHIATPNRGVQPRDVSAEAPTDLALRLIAFRRSPNCCVQRVQGRTMCGDAWRPASGAKCTDLVQPVLFDAIEFDPIIGSVDVLYYLAFPIIGFSFAMIASAANSPPQQISCDAHNRLRTPLDAPRRRFRCSVAARSYPAMYCLPVSTVM